MTRVALILAVILVFGLLVSLVRPASAQQEYPNVSSLVPFSAEANYMSLAGFLRWRHFVTSGEWISRDEAVRVVRQQGGKA
jgi:hypothetical protein